MGATLAMGLLLVSSSAAVSKIAVLPTQFDESSKGKVPNLFDDYILTAVQNLGGHEVLGQDDIATLLDFEKQKDLLDCGDASCLAEIGNALGVDKVVAIKVARLGEDWVTTAKLIDIQAIRVDSRANLIVPGDVKALLTSVETLVAKLFGIATPAAAPSEPSAGPVAKPAPKPAEAQARRPPPGARRPSVPTGETRQPNAGSGAKTTGTVLLVAGLVLTGGGGALWSRGILNDSFDESFAIVILGAGGVILGLILQGVGSKVRANGVARNELGTRRAFGRPPLRWLAWLLFAGTMVSPIVGLLAGFEPESILAMNWAFAGGASLAFTLGALVGVDAQYASLPLPTVTYARAPDGSLAPGIGFAFRF